MMRSVCLVSFTEKKFFSDISTESMDTFQKVKARHGELSSVFELYFSKI